MHFGVFLAVLACSFNGAAAQGLTSPVNRIVGLLRKLRITIESEGIADQQFYDQFACWVGVETKKLRHNIEIGEKEVKRCNVEILELEGVIGTFTTKIKNMQKDYHECDEAQRTADQMRKNENEEYLTDMEEKDACSKALQAAIAVLTDSGAGKVTGFLQQAQVMSIVGRVRRVLAMPAAVRNLSDDDLALLQRFVQSPDDAPNAGSATMSALQAGQQQNPYGDYAPQADRIVGILKSMLNTFREDMVELEEREKEAVQYYEKMTSVRKGQMNEMEWTLENNNKLLTEQKVSMAETREARTGASQDLKEDKASLYELTIHSRNRSMAWSKRSLLRTYELKGIIKALDILTSPEAQKIFREATKPNYVLAPGPAPAQSFLQIAASSSSKSQQMTELARQRGYSELKRLARRSGSMRISRIALQLQVTGHFDKVIQTCKEMIEKLRAEEKADIAHMDRCQSATNANKNDMEDLGYKIDKAKHDQKGHDYHSAGIAEEIRQREAMIPWTEKEMKERLEARNAEHAEFKKSVKDDTQMMELLQKAVVAIQKYYKDNKMVLNFLQGHRGGHRRQRYDPRTASSLKGSWDSTKDTVPWNTRGDAHTQDAGDIISMLNMLKEDAENEIKIARAEEKEAQTLYEEERDHMHKDLHIQRKMIAMLTAQKADADAQAEVVAKEINAKDRALETQKDLKAALGHECGWLQTNFDSRRHKRKIEMEGLTQAIAYLSGV